MCSASKSNPVQSECKKSCNECTLLYCKILMHIHSYKALLTFKTSQVDDIIDQEFKNVKPRCERVGFRDGKYNLRVNQSEDSLYLFN